MKRQEEIKEDFQKFRQATIEKLKRRLEDTRRLIYRVNLLKEEFERKEEDVGRDLEEANRLWWELSGRFRWWQKQEIP